MQSSWCGTFRLTHYNIIVITTFAFWIVKQDGKHAFKKFFQKLLTIYHYMW